MHLALGLMGLGFAAAVCAAIATFSWRREGVSAGALWLAGSKVASRPELFVRPDRVRAVRALNLFGVALWLAGAVALLIRA